MIQVGKLNEYKLIKFVNNQYILSWGLTKNGADLYTWNYITLSLKPSITDIKNIINGYYNNITKNNIENNFKWNGMNISLTLENQIDYKLLYDTTIILKGSNLPEKVKFKIGKDNIYYSFEDIDEIKDFIVSMNNHIRKYLNIGYNIKDSIDWNEYENYLKNI